MDFTKLKQGIRCADCGLDISKATDKSNESDVKTADDGYSVFLLFARIIGGIILLWLVSNLFK